MSDDNANIIQPFSDEYFMKAAFQQAISAFEKKEVPVGVVIVSKNKIIARAHNLTERLGDVTAHAEMQAITAAANHLGGKYLTKCTLYVTLEPCGMCAGGSAWSQIGRVVFGASDFKRGYRAINPKMFHPKTKVTSGIMAVESSALLKQFFQDRRSDY
jgi:tRNA(adenine34) deaminase